PPSAWVDFLEICEDGHRPILRSVKPLLRHARLLCVAVLFVIFQMPSIFIRLWKSIHTSDGTEVRSHTICTEATSPTWVTETIRPTTLQLGGAAQCAKFSEMRFFVSLPSAST